ncbi:Ku protein [Ramlibacter sp.]|uniref:non-homologous end joining protein Ku n=1 Tax=Ramlibacter sp. TaxID=1917967 RepID=UPI002D740B4B|nr:Ku protein [Ramlibacter sp.]HYD77597.1 Ku protein [Ramlibacter sp.]
MASSAHDIPSTEGMAPSSTRTLWKGAITFGLVHIPIGLYSATAESGIDFDWLDKRTMDPVGYKRINKKTGEDIDKDNIVKGVKWHTGEYVVVSPDEIAKAYPRTTQTIEIEAFVDADEVPFVYLERPYYVAPINKGDKVYALLREALRQTGKIGIAKVVIQTKQHLAVLIPSGPALVLNLVRWGNEIRTWEDLKLPPADAKAAGVKEPELNMAKQLIEGMSGHWTASAYRDSFSEEIMKLVEAKAQAGQLETVTPVEPAPAGAEVIDLTELLRRSLRGKAAEPAPAPAPAARTSTRAKAPAPARARKEDTEEKAVARDEEAGEAGKGKRKATGKTAAKSRTRRAA